MQDIVRNEFRITTDRSQLDYEAIREALNKTYWAAGRSLAAVRSSIDHSFPFGLFRGNHQIGFARAITDFTVFAYLGDVYIHEDFRGRGLGRWLIQTVVGHSKLKSVKWLLTTHDAQEFYLPLGFRRHSAPDYLMERPIDLESH